MTAAERHRLGLDCGNVPCEHCGKLAERLTRPTLRPYQLEALERMRAALRDPIDTWGVARVRFRVNELDRWILEFNPSGSAHLLAQYQGERRELRAWLARGKRGPA